MLDTIWLSDNFGAPVSYSIQTKHYSEMLKEDVLLTYASFPSEMKDNLLSLSDLKSILKGLTRLATL